MTDKQKMEIGKSKRQIKFKKLDKNAYLNPNFIDFPIITYISTISPPSGKNAPFLRHREIWY